MEGFENIQLFAGAMVPLVGVPVVLSAVTFTEKGDCLCERYFFLSDYSKSHFAADDLIIYDKPDLEASEIVGDPAEFLNKMVVDDAAYFADSVLYDIHEKTGCPLPEPVTLIKADIKQFNDLWHAGAYKAKIEALKIDSKIPELRRLLDKVTRLPATTSRIAAVV